MESVGSNEKIGHFQGQRCPELDRTYRVGWSRRENWPFSRSKDPRASKPPILPIFVCYIVHESFGDLDFRRHFC
ncbi:hypothetical protein H5410_056443 [Solanum commersonii]|uniref:Uncharacterized protein n=1 Tax=Solanum commersonii TaxID=4109 RepID=A0A9J5WLQ9_SOLCO|nr:hypothetical protein H5410_056443 [Solanum commersonii]